MLITGDLTDCGLPEEYEILRGLLSRLPMPVFAMPGNHDRREGMRKALAERMPHLIDSDFIQYVVDEFPVRLIGLDTIVPGKSAGALCASGLRFSNARSTRRRTGRRSSSCIIRPLSLAWITWMRSD